MLVKMVIAVVLSDLDCHLEEVGEVGGGQHFFFATVGYDFSVAQQDNALDLRDDFGDVVRHEQNSQPRLS